MTERSTETKNISTRLSLFSVDLTERFIEQLRELAPLTFSEGQFDVEKFQAVIGEQPVNQPERYGLNWAGKRDAFRNVQIPSVAALRPQFEESVNWDSTENLIIEGDNLEVLKLLQKPYHGKIKMIYIDPPYNTGNEFIYPDNFREGLDEYLRYTGQRKADGMASSTNKDTSGRYHSNWLNMMYPRLFLARNLLREDGVIFVSIDDHEVHNLRLLMDEVFGEETFIVQLTWKSRKYPDARAKTGVSTDHEYILIYGRDAVKLRGIERDESKFSNPDQDKRGAWMSRSLLGLATREQRPNLHYTITDPITGLNFAPPADTGWRYSSDRMNQLIASKSILFPSKPDGRPREKKFREDMQSELIAFPSIIDDTFTADGTTDIRALFGSDLFDFTKPPALLRKLIAQGADDNSIVLDFFAGSGTTAQAVFEQNKLDGLQRKFILVQLPEKTDKPGYTNIAEITRQRVKKAIDRLKSESTGKLALGNGESKDLGFRAFKLDSSNFKIWEAEHAPVEKERLAEQLSLYANNLHPARSELDRLYEIILKSGLPLSSEVVPVKLSSGSVYLVAQGTLAICLEEHISRTVLSEIFSSAGGSAPQMVVCLDAAFDGNDSLKTNAVLEAQAKGITFKTV